MHGDHEREARDTMTDEARTVAFQLAGAREVAPTDWAATAAHVRDSLAADGLPGSAMAEAMNGFRFLDESGASWTYDGAGWLRSDGRAWVPQTPPAALRLQPFTLDWLPDPTERPPVGVEPLEAAFPAPAVSGAPAAAQMVTPQAPAYRPTHRVPVGGIAAWANPDPATSPAVQLSPGLDVMLVEAYPNGRARVRASNGWLGWVDGRLLIPG
jgi:hypothetical protein